MTRVLHPTNLWLSASFTILLGNAQAAIALGSIASTKAAAPRVSVTRFSQEADHILDGCRGWDFGSGQDQMRTELEHALVEKGLKILERRSIRAMHDNEYELPNLNQKSVAKRNQFLAAQYSISGAITELGVCEHVDNNGLQLGGLISILGGPSDTSLNVRKRSVTSTVKLIAKLVSVETGEVLRSFEAHSEIEEDKSSVSGSVYGMGGDHTSRNRPPIERATNEAIQQLAGQISEHIKTIPL